MDTSRTPTSADDEQQNRMSSNQYAYQENAYHQKPPSFNHKQVNVSLVDDGTQQAKKPTKAQKTEKEQASGEWRESIPIRLEHLLFNFKENSLKVYKQSPPRIMQLIALIAALLIFCGVLALVLSQRDDNLMKKEANLPLDQSAIAERIIGESLLSGHKLKNALFEKKNQTVSGDKSKKYSKSEASAKDAAVRKAFGSLLHFSADDNDDVEPDQEENSSDESFDGERSRSRNFNLFLSDNDRAEEKEKGIEQSENPRVMFIERLMGLHFGMQPKFGVSESLVIRKTIGDESGSTGGDAGEAASSKTEPEIDLLFNGRSSPSRMPNSNKIKEARNEDPTPILLRYAAAAMLSRVLATAQQQAYIQQQQQKYREMNEKFGSPYRGYRMMREPESAPSYMMRESPMYGRPMPPPKHQARPFQSAVPFVGSDRGYSRGPLITNEEAESQQIHPIILMLNIPHKDQSPALMYMGNGQQSSMQPIFMPSRHNPYFKPPQQQLPHPLPPQREPVYTSPFAQHHKNHHTYQSTSPSGRQLNEGGYYAPALHHHSYMPPPPPMNRAQVTSPQQRYNHRIANTIEVPIEIHHQVTPSASPIAIGQPQIIVQPQLETQSQPSDSNDQSGENEHHMVVFYSDADNLNHSEENNVNSVANSQPAQQAPQQAVFLKESKQINNDLEKANQISKMLLLHFVNPNGSQQPPTNQQPPVEHSAPEPQADKPMNSKLEEMMIMPGKSTMNQSKPSQIKPEVKNEETSDQIRDEMFEKSETASNPNESEAEPTSLAHFAQVIRHQLQVIDQQDQDQQRPTVQPIQQQSPVSINIAQQSAPNQAQQQSSNFEPIRKEIQLENSNKEVEKPQESAQSPAFMLVQESDEN